MKLLEFIKNYWVIITFLFSGLMAFFIFIKSMIEATKCSLRNDILDIYDRCKEDGKITYYQLEAMKYSAEIYFKLKGNSFVQDVVKRAEQFELID